MANLGKLQVEIGADSSGLNRGIGEAESRLSRFGQQARATINRLGQLTIAAGAVGIALGVKMVNSVMKSADEHAKLARQLMATNRGLEVLKRAGDLAGMSQDQMVAATRRLNVSTGEAIQGMKRQSDAFDQLGLSAREVANMDADERIRAITQALRENVPAAERAAVAGALFGNRVGAAMLELDPETFARAAEEVDAFGLAMSEIDSRTIERANDSMSALREMIRGVAQRITVELAPFIEAMVTHFRDAAVEGGGLGRQVEMGMAKAGRAVGFVLDGVRGLQVVFKGAQLAGSAFSTAMLWIADKISKAFELVLGGITDRIRSVIEVANRIKGIDISTDGLDAFDNRIAMTGVLIEGWADESRENTKALASDLSDLVNQPMPTETLSAWAEEVRNAAREASQAAEDARESFAMGGDDDGLAEQREALREHLEGILEQQRMAKMEELELEEHQHAEKMAMLEEQFGEELELREQFLEAIRNEEERHAAAVAEIKKKAADAERKIAEQKAQAELNAQRQGNQQMLAAGTQFAEASFGQNKTASIAIAGVKGIASAISAWEAGMSTGGPQAPLVAAAYTAASLARTGAMISQLRSQTMGGGASAISAPSGSAPQPSGGGQRESGPTRSASVHLHGDVFSREGVMNLASQMNELHEDGYMVTLS